MMPARVVLVWGLRHRKVKPVGEHFTQLLARARRGDRTAVDALWARHQAAVRGLLARRMNPLLRAGYDTDDLAQSVFAEMLRDLPRLEDRGEDKFRHWLYIKAENKVRGKLRKSLRGARIRALQGDGRLGMRGANSADRPEAAEERLRLQSALEALEETSRAVVRLKHDQGLAYDEIAACLGLASPEAARKRHARALLDLRTALARGSGVASAGRAPRRPRGQPASDDAQPLRRGATG
jgi:RNA polymerase sigma-70 factor (ECF subfamily)